ncbi:type I methionyl aminopeptidase [Candidatus Kaiserbacteria bacterium CG10_big_fil_rev_8_21_14_0_10_56_12]|uniref:Methionine aminopeptidase n=1 Tax=Candidatus Kaiserbacteria bacterium CG10_big_fil_rev_8_21_14_0_10_56_12 TaxID=1974611 RepID=A0A2H0U9G7_9BACT|nr:MAG: type I methionyl aminopeptidase [Candidatus Kaiserbacteria bacterium CG10_big_fil_rev_8_21_14_0_10_56_12]
MTITSEEQRVTLVEAGRRLAQVLAALRTKIAPGVSTEDLDDLAEAQIRDGGDEPCFLGYTPDGAVRPYPATLCVSINDEVVHGIPNESPKILKEGDIVSLDLGLTHNGIIVDAAITVPVGVVDAESTKLMRATEEALAAGIKVAKAGVNLGNVSHAIQDVVERAGFKVVRDLGGHGVGERVHEEPFIANFGRVGEGPELKEGMVLALEPISTAGKAAVVLASDGYTYRTKDGSRSAHFEHTILIEKAGACIVTEL